MTGAESMLPIAGRTISVAHMFFVSLLTVFAMGVFSGPCFNSMLRVMFGACKDNQIFYAIIISYAIDMMNNFRIIKKSANNFFHYKSVLENVSLMTSRVVGGVLLDISISICSRSTFPIRVLISFLVDAGVFVKAFSRTVFCSIFSKISHIESIATNGTVFLEFSKYSFHIRNITVKITDCQRLPFTYCEA